MKRLNFFLLFFCFAVALSGQSLSDQLNTLLASPRDTHQVKQLIALSDSFAYARRDIPDVLFERGLEIANELDFERGLADLYTARYIYFMNSGAIEKGLVDVEKAIKHARIIDDQSLLRFSQLNHIDLLMIGGYTEESAELGTSLAKEFRASGDLIGESGAYRSLATLSAGLGNRDLAAVYDSTSIALARRSGKDWLLSRAIFNAAANKALLGIPEEALPLAEEAMALAKKLGSAFGVENAAVFGRKQILVWGTMPKRWRITNCLG